MASSSRVTARASFDGDDGPDAGLLSSSKYKRRRSTVPSDLADEEKFALEVSRIVSRERRKLEDSGKCSTCWLSVANCMCKEVVQLPPSKHQVVILMHYKEYARPSNTGKLIVQGVKHSRILIYGVPEDMKVLNRLTEMYRDRIWLLFPSERSIALEQIIASEKQMGTNPAKALDQMVHETNCLKVPVKDGVIVVLDGTWSQARRMLKSLPSIPHVHICSRISAKSLFNPARKQSEPARICTLEAVVEALRVLGYSETCCRRLLRYLVILVDRMLHQSHSMYVKGTYGTIPVASIGAFGSLSMLNACHLTFLKQYLPFPDYCALKSSCRTSRRLLIEYGQLPVPSSVLF